MNRMQRKSLVRTCATLFHNTLVTGDDQNLICATCTDCLTNTHTHTHTLKCRQHLFVSPRLDYIRWLNQFQRLLNLSKMYSTLLCNITLCNLIVIWLQDEWRRYKMSYTSVPTEYKCTWMFEKVVSVCGFWDTPCSPAFGSGRRSSITRPWSPVMSQHGDHLGPATWTTPHWTVGLGREWDCCANQQQEDISTVQETVWTKFYI